MRPGSRPAGPASGRHSAGSGWRCRWHSGRSPRAPATGRGSQGPGAPPRPPAVRGGTRRFVRGEITARDGERLAWSVEDENGEPYRVYLSRSLSGVVGYASRTYGTAGLERAFDAELSGVTAADPVQDLLKKFRADPSDPQALRTTPVASLQQAAVGALGDDSGAVVMADPRTGEV